MLIAYLHPDLPGHYIELDVGEGLHVCIERTKDGSGRAVRWDLKINGRLQARSTTPFFIDGADPFDVRIVCNDGPNMVQVLMLQDHYPELGEKIYPTIRSIVPAVNPAGRPKALDTSEVFGLYFPCHPVLQPNPAVRKTKFPAGWRSR